MRDMNRSSVGQLFSTAPLLRFLLVLSFTSLALVGCTAHADRLAEAPPPANMCRERLPHYSR
jgi:hypothetical protein